ncbi:MAG: hypothetical protein JWO02_4016 [Solirubrobacterales bacterium]|nr:hypothetical protein [Solirubrobacterales bacterium]
MSTYATVTKMLEAAAGEPVRFGASFSPPRFQSTFLTLWRLGQRATGSGGIGAQFAVNNYIAVSESRVLLWRGPVQPELLLAQWPRDAVTGTAIRKHWVSGGDLGHDKWILRTTLSTPDGEVVIDLDEKQGGRKMLRSLGVKVPEQKPRRWWRSSPDD